MNSLVTLEETMALAASMPGLDQTSLQTIRVQTNGWVAGTVLMLERWKISAAGTAPNASETHTDLFAYFAQQVFAQLEDRTKTVLLRTALLPWMTGLMAEEVSGQSGAEQVLHDLYQRGLFVDRHAGTQLTYHYHDLFREFLVDYCLRRHEADELLTLRRTAASVAERTGQLDIAVTLYAETHSWNDLSRVICESAEQLLAQGRNQTLQGYIARLPHEEQQYRPWLLYWSGISRLVFDPGIARKDFEAAYQQFNHTGNDLEGLLLSCSGVIESIYCCAGDMTPTIPWGDRIQQILHTHNGFPSQAIEARVLTNLQGLIFACPHHALIQELEGSLDETLHSFDDPIARIGVATTFLNLLIWRGHFSRVDEILNDLTSLNRGTTLPPVHLLTWKVMEAHYAWGTGDRLQATTKLDEALQIAETFGILVFQPLVRSCQLFHAMSFGDYVTGQKVAELLSIENPLRLTLAIVQGMYQLAGISLMRGELSNAIAHATVALETIVPLSLPFFTCNCHIGVAKILIEQGEFWSARTHLDKAINLAKIMRSPWLEAQCLMSLSYSYLREWQTRLADEPLREGLRIACRNDYIVLDFWWRPKVMAELMAHALEAEIEVEYVRSVIRRRDLRVPFAGVKHWPYPVKIATLGRFEVAIDDIPLTTTGKSQRKPLELLKYLCAAGLSGANQELIEETLWPEADGEAADQAFRTTLHRLRKLLHHDDAVQLSDGHISLDLSLVSLDHMAFEHRVRHIARTDSVALEQTLALYRGHFLQGESAPWILPVRERLRAQFLTLTERLGTVLEERGKLTEAVQQYLHALEVEPVAEVMCRRVMMTYVRLGRRSEAIGVYQRFSRALQTKLDVPPTPETVSLYHNIAKT